jgi:cytochrome P450
MEVIGEKGAEEPINLVEFFNWATFDVLGELAFGESFNSLKNRKTDPWISIILDSIKFNAWDVVIWKLPILPWLQYWLTPASVREGGLKQAHESKDKTLKRATEKTNRKDFVSYILLQREELGISDWKMAAHSNALIVAGSETSASTLSGMHYWLLSTPHSYYKLRAEVRGRFNNLEDIDAHSATSLPYLTACIEETSRIYPPIPIAMLRVTPKGGCTITGEYVPGGVSISSPLRSLITKLTIITDNCWRSYVVCNAQSKTLCRSRRLQARALDRSCMQRQP